MSKKGEVSLEALVKFIPHLILTIALIAILFIIAGVFWAKNTSPAEQDYKLIAEELEIMINQEYTGQNSITIPVTAQSSPYYRIILYSSTNSPPVCRSKACLCLYHYHDTNKEWIETCKPHEKILRDCGSQCAPCITESSQVEIVKEKKHTVTITRTCDQIKIS